MIRKIINAYQSGCVSCLGNKSYFPFCDNIYCVIQSLQSLWNISKIIKKTTTIKSEESSKPTSGLSHYLVGFFFFERNVQYKKMTTFVTDGPRRNRRENISV